LELFSVVLGVSLTDGEAFLQQAQSVSCSRRPSWLGSLLELFGRSTCLRVAHGSQPLGSGAQSAVTIALRDPQVSANWLKPIPNSPISPAPPTGQLAVLIWLHLDRFASSLWSFCAEKPGLFTCTGCQLHANALGGPVARCTRAHERACGMALTTFRIHEMRTADAV
jgi:hypothetical protein